MRTNFVVLDLKFLNFKKGNYEFQIHYNHSYVENMHGKKDKKEIYQYFNTTCLRVVRFLVIFFFFIHFSVFQILNHEIALLLSLE